MRDEEGELTEDLQRLYGGVAGHVLKFADDIDREARAKLKASGA